MSETARAAAGTVDEEIRPEDSASNGSHSRTSSSVSARRKELNAKKAVLKAEAAMLNQQHQLEIEQARICLLYTSPSPRDGLLSRMPSSA